MTYREFLIEKIMAWDVTGVFTEEELEEKSTSWLERFYGNLEANA